MIAVGAAITTVTLENTTAAPLSNVPLTSFAQAFKKGDLPAAGAAVELRAPDNSVIPCQLDVRVLHPDGSVLHAVISAIIPALAASASVTYGIVRKAAGSAPTPAVPSDFPGLDAAVTITDGGTAYSVSLATLLAGTRTIWLSGNVVSEWEVAGPLKTAGNVEHAHLHVRFCVRGYKGQAKARIDITVENTWAWNTASQDVPCDVAMTVGGATVYTNTGLVHHPRTRYRKVFWWNAVEPPVHIKHDIDYLISSRAVPNYDRSVVPDAANALIFKNNTVTNGGPMGRGTARANMGDVGGRADIGLLPGWTALYLISMNRDAKEATLNQGNQAGSWPAHFRDKNTGRVISFNDWPYFATSGSIADANNPATGQSEKVPALVSNTNPNSSDVSHHPDQAFIPYLVTGDVYYLEELQFWAQAVAISQNPHATARGAAKGLVFRDQIRAQAWALRTLAHAAYISPPGVKQAEFEFMLRSNIDWFDARYTNNSADDAKLGALVHSFPYGMGYAATSGQVNGVAQWQDDHFTSALGRSVELGFTFALPLLTWKSKYTVGRLYGVEGVCWVQAAAYCLRVRDTSSSPIYTTLREAYEKSMSPAIIAAAADSNCGTQAMADAWLNYNAWRTTVTPSHIFMDGVSNPSVGDMDGYSDSVTGYPSNLQPAIAYCATFGMANATNGWNVFEGRSVKPNYGPSPQFAIVPRAASAGNPDPQPTGITMTIADRVKDSTTTTGTGAFALAGAPEMNFRPFLTDPIVVGSVVPYAANHRTLNEWESGFGTLTAALTLARTTVTANHLGTTAPIHFSEGTKDVSCDLTAEFMKRFASVDSASTTAVANTEVSAVLIVDAGVVKQIPVDDFVATLGTNPSVFDAPFSTVIPLSQPGTAFMPQQSVAGVLDFTVGTDPVRGSLVYLRLVANGTNAPTFTGFKEWGGSLGYDNRNGIVNQVQFFFDGIDYWYSISQAVGAVAVDNVAPTITSAAVANTTPSIVRLTMSEAIDAAYPCVASAFTIGGHTGSGNVAISGIYVDVTVTAPFVYGEAARTVTYTQPGTNNLRDITGNLLGTTATPVPIANNVAAPATKPATMAAPVATAGQLSASVAFVMPANGGSAITNVTIVASTGQSASGMTSPIAIPMPGGTAVTFTAYATNGVGPGDASPASNSVTPSSAATEPAAPTIGTAVAGDGYVDVAYTANSDGGSAILDATATLSTGETATGTTSPIRVAAANGTARTATVKTRNAVGTSAASAASNSVTPAAPTETVPRMRAGFTNLTETGTGPYQYTALNSADFTGAKGGILNLALQSGVDGSFAVTKSTTATVHNDQPLLGVNPGTTLLAFGSMPVCVLHSTASPYNYQVLELGVSKAVVNAVPAAFGDVIRLRRAGSTLVSEVSKDSGATWTTLYTSTGQSTGALYYQIILKTAAKVENLTAVGLA